MYGVKMPILACLDLFSVERPKNLCMFFIWQETNKDGILDFFNGIINDFTEKGVGLFACEDNKMASIDHF